MIGARKIATTGAAMGGQSPRANRQVGTGAFRAPACLRTASRTNRRAGEADDTTIAVSDLTADYPQIDALVRHYDLARSPIHHFVTGDRGHLDHDTLRFGSLYRLRRGIAGNVGGRLEAGKRVRFLGARVPGWDEVTQLWFETVRGEARLLEFAPTQPADEGTCARVPETAEVFAPAWLDLSKRRRQLLGARAILIHYRRTFGDTAKATSDGDQP